MEERYVFVPTRYRTNRGFADPTYVQALIGIEGEDLEEESFTWGPKRVYFMRVGPAIKIGVSSNVRRRMQELRGCNSEEIYLIGSLVGGAHLEWLMHRRFKKHHIRGEWFKLEILADVMDLISQDLDYFSMRGVAP